MNKIDKKLSPIENFSNEMVNMAINGINEAVARERLKTTYWMRQAYILKSKLGKCRDCSNNTQKKELDMWFYELGGSDCGNCDDLENERNTNFIKQNDRQN